MNTEEYIASGMIESYVLGLTSAEEAAEVELLASEHVEIRQAINNFSSSLENYALQNKMQPPAAIKDNVLNALSGDFAEETEPEKRKEYIPISTERTPLRIITMWKFMAAASIILLVISAALNFYFYSNYKTANTQYQALLNDRNSLQANNNQYQVRMDSTREIIDSVTNRSRMLQNNLKSVIGEDVVAVRLKGLPGRKNNNATVYWNQKTRSVYFFNNNLDKAPEGKQYQLWAIIGGTPVSVGLVGDCDDLLCHMQSVNADKVFAFAVTLENKGGSEKPTLTQMYVLGKT